MRFPFSASNPFQQIIVNLFEQLIRMDVPMIFFFHPASLISSVSVSSSIADIGVNLFCTLKSVLFNPLYTGEKEEWI